MRHVPRSPEQGPPSLLIETLVTDNTQRKLGPEPNLMTNMVGIRSQPALELIDSSNGCSILYRDHGFPHPLVRWHYHPEYELHFITATTGKVFVGDYIGNFAPGNLILTGPNLPHNWISNMKEGESVSLRDRVIVFTDELIQASQITFPEFTNWQAMLERARYGILFQAPDTINAARQLFEQAAVTQGASRLITFFSLMQLLANCTQYQLLSSNTYVPNLGKRNQLKVNQAVNFIFERYTGELTLEEVAAHLGMKPTYFSRFFKQATGRRFIEFVGSLRISRACELLSQSDMAVTDICFEAGFSNISNFNRRFLAHKGMTPSEYRHQALSATAADPNSG